jgi:hypothetical protein
MGEDVGRGCMWYQYCIHMDVNGEVQPVETIPRMDGGGKRRMMEGVNSTMIYCKNFCKCHNVPQHNNNK